MNCLPYEPQPRQQLFHDTDAEEILYGGQAGGGKSYCLRWDAIDFCINVPGINATLFRRTLPMLERNHVRFLKRELPESFGLGRYNETRKMYEFKNGSILEFKHIEYDRDCDDLQGAELHWAGIDEAGQMTPYMIAYIKSRVRLGSFEDRLQEMIPLAPEIAEYAKRLPRLAMSSNPGGESHHWLKENFIDPAPPEQMFEAAVEGPDGPIKKRRIFIPASMNDNRYLDANYWAQFSELPEWQQKQLRDGDWNVVPGAFFDCFGPDNVIQPFAVPEWWTRFRACDWGFRQPFWIGEFVVSDGSPVESKTGTITYPVDTLICIWEWYGREKGNKGIRMPAQEVGTRLKARGDVEYSVGSPDMWRSDSGPSVAERFATSGIFWMRADDERVAGWQEMYRRLNSKSLLFVNHCVHAIRTIPTLEHDEKKMEDVQKKGEDHPGDGVRYACMSRPYRTVKPAVKKPYWEDIKPPTFNDIMNVKPKAWRPEVI